MKIIIGICALVILFHGVLRADTRVMNVGDPNLEPTWSWKSDTYQTLFSSAVGESPASEHSVLLPFFTSGNVLKTAHLDMDEKDGWELVHRDFGISKKAQPFPYFTLYNKYRGIFRVMLFNAMVRQDSYYLGELSFLEPSVVDNGAVALMTFPRKEKCFLNNFELNPKLTATSFMQAFGDWAVFDFPLVGYDPAMETKDPIVTFTLTGIDIQKLTANGNGDLDLLQRAKAKEVRPNIGIGDLVKAADAGLHYYRTPLNWMDELTNEKNKNRNWYSSALRLSTTAAASFTPWIAALGGVVESFIGGANKASNWEPLRFSGQFQFSVQGGLEMTRRLWAQDFYLKPGPQSATAQRPVNAVNWGVFNLRDAPVLVEEKQDLMGTFYFYLPISGGGVVVNPTLDMDLVSTRVALKTDQAWNPFPPNPRYPVPGFQGDTSYFTDYKEFCQLGIIRLKAPVVPKALTYELKFKTRHPTKEADDEIVFIKTIALDPPVAKRDRPWQPMPPPH
jgi:hypothetical protein